MKVVVTGASGFVGNVLCRRLAECGFEVTAAVRRKVDVPGAFSVAAIEEIGDEERWVDLFKGAAIVFHLAAMAHIRAAHDDLLRLVNVRGSAAVARASVRAGIGRLVFLSSAKVYGEDSGNGAFCEEDPPAPEDGYGTSKLDAEQHILQTVGDRFPVSIVRSPLVYGPFVRANFLELMKLVDGRIPLPLGAVRNRRSLIFVGNLADAIIRLSTGSAGIYNVSDGQDMSTPELIRNLAMLMNRRPLLVPIPAAFLNAAARLGGVSKAARKLIGSLALDTTKIETDLKWVRPFTSTAGLQETVKWYQGRATK